MKVLMLKDVKGVAQRDTIKEVSDGYALNFLIAQGLAVQATPTKLAEFEAKKKIQTTASAEKDKEWAGLAKKLQDMVLEVKARANDAGHLYKQLSAESIVEALRAQYQMSIPADAIVIHAPIKSAGEVTVGAKFGTHHAAFKVLIVGTK